MILQKSIDIIVDYNSWLPNPVPSDIVALGNMGQRITDVGAALIHTALWTRPPVSLGFTLSDFWAWLRYGAAVASSPELRLKDEWRNIDPHQKTVLSDELGVGFTTQLFAETLNFLVYADTHYVVNAVAPSWFDLGSTAKRGPRKSPDYIAIDNKLDINVLECKGSQTSRDELFASMSKGVDQKRNLSVSTTSIAIKHSLVGGLFIPQWNKSENPLLCVRDPSWDILISLLRQVPREYLIAGVIQIGLAKHFALMGLTSLATVLATTKTEELRWFLPRVDEDLDFLLPGSNDEELVFEIEHILPITNHKVEDRPVRRVKFTMSCPRQLYYRFVRHSNILGELLEIARRLYDLQWKTIHTDYGVIVVSPLGFTLAIEYDRPQRAAR